MHTDPNNPSISSLSLAQLIELSAALATTVLVAGYTYAQIKALSLGLFGQSVFGLDDYLRFGTQPLLLVVSVILLAFISPFNLTNGSGVGGSFPAAIWSGIRDVLPMAIAASIFAAIFSFVRVDPALSGYSRLFSGFVGFIAVPLGLLLLEAVAAARKVWGSDLNPRNIVLWLLVTLVTGAGILVALETFSGAKSLSKFTFSDDIKIPADATFAISTSNHVVFKKKGGGLLLVPADKIETIEN